jgi:VWFA-related protein
MHKINSKLIAARRWGLLVLGIVLVRNAGAQPPVFKSDVREVTVVFRVVDKHDQVVSGITRSEVQIEDEGTSRTITSFRGDVANAQIVILVDVSGSMSTVFEPLQGALANFADIVSKDFDREPGDVLLSLLPFSDTATMLIDRTPNPAEFKEAVERLRPGGSTALVDTVLATLLNAFGDKPAASTRKAPSKSISSDQEDAPIPSEFRPRRPSAVAEGAKRSKFLVIFTDAGENASAHQWSDIATAMLGKDVVIYSIPFDSGTLDSNFQMLSKITAQSGGKVRRAKADNLKQIYSDIAHDIRSHYQLTFAATGIENRHSWRNIRLSTSRPGVTVLARTGYCPETPCQKPDGSFVGGRPRTWNEIVTLNRDPAVVFSVKEKLKGLRLAYSSETQKIVSDLAGSPLLIEKAWDSSSARSSKADGFRLIVHKADKENQSVNIDAEVCGIKLDSEPNSLSQSSGESVLSVIDPEIRLAKRPGQGQPAESGQVEEVYFQSQALFYLKDVSGRIPSRIRVQCNRPHFLISDDLVQFAVQALEQGLKVKSQGTQPKNPL